MPESRWKKAICGICPAGCWVDVKLDSGKLTAIRADEDAPLGMICRRGEHAPEMIYSEHRIRYPLKRSGSKGTYEFERISWDEAYEVIAQNLLKIRKESGPEAAAIYTGRGAFELSLCDMFQPKGVAVSSASNILFPFGSPNTMGVGALCYVSFAMIAPHVTMGRMLISMFTDIENAELLLIWGANPATDSPPLDMSRLEAAAQRGAKVVVVDPRRTETARRTDGQWVPIRPGTDGALALSMISVIIEEELYDEDFADTWCYGFDQLKSYVQHFSPEKVESITGVPTETIRSLGRRICSAKGACPVMYTGLEYSNSGIQAIRAVLTLFALAGQLDVPGGIGLAMPDTHFPINRSCNVSNPFPDKAVARDRFPVYSDYRGESHASGLISSVLEDDPYRIRGFIIHGASLLTSWPQSAVWRKTLSNLDFLVCIDRQLTADAAYADIILPATTMFEIQSYMVYGPIFRLREKIIEPVGESRNDYLIMAELAKHLGYGHLFPQTEDELVRFVLDGSGYSLEDVRKAGGWIKKPSPFMEYKKWEKGSLRRDREQGFETPSGKFEIYSTVLEDYGYESLPKYTEVREGPVANPKLAQTYPLVFNSGARPQTDFRSQHHGIDGLVKDHREPMIEINPKDAASRDIKTGDLVQVSTLRGSVPFRARVTDDIVAGAVECNQGGGGPVGPQAWQEWNVNELTDMHNFDEISGFPVYKALLCQIKKIEEGTQDTRNSALLSVDMRESSTALNEAGSTNVKNRIYLDNNATTRVAEAVHESMLPFLDDALGNPASIHQVGRRSLDAVEEARRKVAKFINSRPKRIVFTGSGTESDNLAIKGVAYAYREKGDHIVTTSIEHPAVLSSCQFLERMGFHVTYLDVDQYGFVKPEQLKQAICDNTILVSIMLANNVVGTILPIKDLCEIAHERSVLFHTDAVQAVGKIGIDIVELGVDLLSLSGHKFHGPKGVGALYVKKNVHLEPVIHGGKQESGFRAGTLNVPAVVGLGKAAELAFRTLPEFEKTRQLRDKLEKGFRTLIPGALLNGHRKHRLPNTLNLTLPGMRGESLVIAMDQHGMEMSSGSACKSGSTEPTHVLLAMGRSEEEAHCSVRMSLSHEITEEDIQATLKALSLVLDEMETTIRFLPCK